MEPDASAPAPGRYKPEVNSGSGDSAGGSYGAAMIIAR